MSEIDFAALMEEMPHGENHGRVFGVGRSPSDCGWREIATGERLPRSPAISDDVGHSRSHGTRYGYSKRRCRCEACKSWRREYDRKRRTTPEDIRPNTPSDLSPTLTP